MNLYSIDVKICATAYIKAETPEAAMAIAKQMEGDTIELPENLDYLELPITGKDFSDPDLPDVSLSPAMTVHGPWDGAEPDLSETDIPVDEPEHVDPEDQDQGDHDCERHA